MDAPLIAPVPSAPTFPGGFGALAPIIPAGQPDGAGDPFAALLLGLLSARERESDADQLPALPFLEQVERPVPDRGDGLVAALVALAWMPANSAAPVPSEPIADSSHASAAVAAEVPLLPMTVAVLGAADTPMPGSSPAAPAPPEDALAAATPSAPAGLTVPALEAEGPAPLAGERSGETPPLPPVTSAAESLSDVEEPLAGPRAPPPESPEGEGRAVRTVGSAPQEVPPGDEAAAVQRPGRGPVVAQLVHALDPEERGVRGSPRASETALAHADSRSAVQRSVPPSEGVPSAPAPAPILQSASQPNAAPLPAAAPQAASLPEPMRPVADAVVELGKGGREARIRLDPPELGDVVVRIQRGPEGLHIDVRVDRPETLQLFTVHRASFELQLSQRGLAVAGLAIDLGSGGAGGDGAGDDDPPIRADGGFGELLGIEKPAPSPLQRRARLAYNPDGRLVLWA